MASDDKEDTRKWVGVRISKAMMHQVEEIISRHPEYAWATPNDFIRDATRRYMDYVYKQETLKKAQLAKMPKRVEGVLEETLGDDFAKKFESALEARTRGIDPEKDSEAYMEAVTHSLNEVFGPTVASIVMQRMAKAGNGASDEGEGEGK